MSLVTLLTTSSVSEATQSNLTDTVSAQTRIAADTLKPPSTLKISSVRVGETDLSWTSSASSYVAGYRVLRSENMYGPWKTLANLGKTTLKYTDTTGGATQWIYRVEAVYSNWLSASPGFEAPPPVGRDFFDSFTGPAGLLDKRRTEDGSSVWQVWSGTIAISGDGWTNGAEHGGLGSVAVVRTPTQDATLFMNDVDGAERFILRGKDPQNYIYVGGAAPLSGTWLGLFEIVEVKNGVKNVLMTGNTVLDNQDMRVEIKGSTIKVWLAANKTNQSAGTLFATVSSDFLLNDPTATYFGLGFSRTGFSIGDITFNAI